MHIISQPFPSPLAIVLLLFSIAFASCNKEKLSPDKVNGTYTYTSVHGVKLADNESILVYDSTVNFAGQIVFTNMDRRDNRGGTEYGLYEGSFTLPPAFGLDITGRYPGNAGFEFRCSYPGGGDQKTHFNNRDAYRGSAIMIPIGFNWNTYNYTLPRFEIYREKKNQIRVRVKYVGNNSLSYLYTNTYIEFTATKN